ncbi:MBL fold metallo-hydrolase [Spirochaeta cellobiosiphila]|uniref:MBL fold metallo-hydrolase n=1 Tax=Spirochaeta cellobiosiphila TaxID=504483 RepID=UPI000421E4A0|nr:MBL fold metallo-hydrolase [Spirochaeta cellobiosiphila]
MPNIEILTLNQKMPNGNILIHPTIIYNDNDLVLCDTGYPNQEDQIEKELNRLGFSLKDITKIIITHHDHDHVGSLKAIKDKYNTITIISSENEAMYIENQRKSLRLSQAIEYNKTLDEEHANFGRQFVTYLKSIKSCKVDQKVEEGDYIIPGLQVIATPGHTPGHLSFYDENSETFIAGDSLAIEDNKLVIANPEFTLDKEGCIQSINKIAKMEPKKIICYHGGVMEGDLATLLSDYLD